MLVVSASSGTGCHFRSEDLSEDSAHELQFEHCGAKWKWGQEQAERRTTQKTSTVTQNVQP